MKLTKQQKLIIGKREQIERNLQAAENFVELMKEQLRHLQQNVCRHDSTTHYYPAQYDSWTKCDLCGGDAEVVSRKK